QRQERVGHQARRRRVVVLGAGDAGGDQPGTAARSREQQRSGGQAAGPDRRHRGPRSLAGSRAGGAGRARPGGTARSTGPRFVLPAPGPIGIVRGFVRLRIGGVPYGVGAPLLAGLAEDAGAEFVQAPPTALIEELRKGRLDAALVSSVE